MPHTAEQIEHAEVSSCPFPRPAALEPPAEWARQHPAAPLARRMTAMRPRIEAMAVALVGDTVMCTMAAANRDESGFDGADRMDLHRSPNPHLAFGVGGLRELPVRW